QPGLFRGELPLQARLASSLVRAEVRYQNIVSYLLGRIVVVEDIHAAARVARELPYRTRVVTKDGPDVDAGGSFTAGSVQRSATPPPGWPGSRTTATGSSPWTARWSTPGAASPAAASSGRQACSPAGRRSGSCRTRSRAWPGTAPPPGCAPPSARARPTPWPPS